MDVLERIQSKPNYVKTQYAFLFALVITGSITVIWASTIPARFASDSEKGVSQDTHNNDKNVIADTKAQLGAVLHSQKEILEIDPAKQDAPTPAHKEEPVRSDTEPIGGALGALTPVSTTSTTSTNVPVSSTATSGTTSKPKGQNIILIGTTTKKLSD